MKINAIEKLLKKNHLFGRFYTEYFCKLILSQNINFIKIVKRFSKNVLKNKSENRYNNQLSQVVYRTRCISCLISSEKRMYEHIAAQ